MGTRAEIKNINSFRFVERAIHYEIDRQIDILESGGNVAQETRQYDANKDITRSMRGKEEAHDYRYFPDPDLLPVRISPELLNDTRNSLPELPWQKCSRYQTELGLSNQDARQLSADIDIADFFEQTVACSPNTKPKSIANWITGDILATLNKTEQTITDCPIHSEQLAQLIQRIDDHTISNSIAKQVFQTMWETSDNPDTIIEQQGLKQISDTGELEKIIDDIIANNPNQVEQYRAGKEKLIAFFVGQVMKATKGKANPGQVNQLLKDKLQ